MPREVTSEGTTKSVEIPSDDMKGRIIGREGRNIRAFEQATGVDVIIDDTPGVITVNCFDPVRREIAKLTMEKLIADERIHPEARIEEIVDLTQKEIENNIRNVGKKAVLECNIQGLHPKIVETLGRLHYRTSYGQNVLRHSIEVAYLSQMIADELRLDGSLGAAERDCCMTSASPWTMTRKVGIRRSAWNSAGSSGSPRRCLMRSVGITMTLRRRRPTRRS